MRDFFLLACLGFGLATCGPAANPQTDQAVTGSTEAPPAETALAPALEDSLKKMLTPGEIAVVKQLRLDFLNARTAAQVARVYAQADTVSRLVEAKNEQMAGPDGVNYADMATKWHWLPQVLPFMRAEWLCSECQTTAYVNVTDLVAKAQTTPEAADDQFAALLMAAYQRPELAEGTDKNFVPAGHLGNWSTIDGCDVCGYSNLGNGQITRILQLAAQAKAAGPEFQAKIDELVDIAVPFEGQLFFGSPQAEVLKELETVLALPLLNQAQRDRLGKLKTNLKVGKADGMAIQFNCKTGNCTYNG
ncbi:MAG: hypothetical protein MUC97_18460 [Bernardetiaceae bacterium]|jgi:hypothetical protein|nr:hypothetical protein [Bernardetiaceae bacterium]